VRRTKIVATIGPASRSPETLIAMMEAGLDVARIGMAHGSLEDHLETYQLVREAAAACNKDIAILIDLPGPKVRCSPFEEGGTRLKDGQAITIIAGGKSSNDKVISIDYESVAEDVMIGDHLALGDGNISLVVDAKEGDKVLGHILRGGLAQGRPGFQIPSNRLRIGTPTAQDLVYVDAFVKAGADMIAVSFVRSAHDMRSLGTEPAPKGPLLIAKIETEAAIENLDGIIEFSDAVMVARGDLGLEFPIAELPHLQKRIIHECVARGRPVITATQMLESMVHSPVPTRAEATDAANAVFDGTSAVMLSGESAIGIDPTNAVATLARIIERADEEFNQHVWADVLISEGRRTSGDVATTTTDAISSAACRVAEEINATAIMCLSRTGFTIRAVSRFRPAQPILAVSPDERTIRQLQLSWGTLCEHIADQATTRDTVDLALINARDHGHVQTGDAVVVISGLSAKTKATDTIQVVLVP
jgi:pyruvate kinase